MSRRDRRSLRWLYLAQRVTRRVRIVVFDEDEDEIERIAEVYEHRQIELLKSLITWISLFCFQRNVHAKIQLLLSSRHGVSPGAKEVGR